MVWASPACCSVSQRIHSPAPSLPPLGEPPPFAASCVPALVGSHQLPDTPISCPIPPSATLCTEILGFAPSSIDFKIKKIMLDRSWCARPCPLAEQVHLHLPLAMQALHVCLHATADAWAPPPAGSSCRSGTRPDRRGSGPSPAVRFDEPRSEPLRHASCAVEEHTHHDARHG